MTVTALDPAAVAASRLHSADPDVAEVGIATGLHEGPELDACGLPQLYLVPVPVCEPPFDDELEVPPPPPEPMLPLHQLRLVRLREVEVSPRPGAAPGSSDARPEREPGTTRTPTTALPPVRPAATVIIQGLLEVMAGVRPLRQLQAATSFGLYANLEAATRRRGAPAPRVAGKLRSLHVQERPDGVAEVCATVLRQGRVMAVALRLEGDRDRWCCTQAVGF